MVMQWITLFQKEIIENWRNYKWIWVPLAITALMIMDPITNYYLPEILDKFGGLPEGAVFDMPTPTVSEAYMMSLGQVGSLGILLFVLVGMGIIAEERKSGVAEIVLTKPVRDLNYVTAKWASYALLILISFTIGLLVAWYYISILYDFVSFAMILKILFFYGLWLLFVISLVIFFNTIFRSQGVIAFLSLLVIILISTISSVFSHKIPWSPSLISGHIHNLILTDDISKDLVGSGSVSVFLSIVLLFLSVQFMKSKEII